MLTLPTNPEADLCTIFSLRLYNILALLLLCVRRSSIVKDYFTLRGSPHEEGFNIHNVTLFTHTHRPIYHSFAQ